MTPAARPSATSRCRTCRSPWHTTIGPGPGPSGSASASSAAVASSGCHTPARSRRPSRSRAIGTRRPGSARPCGSTGRRSPTSSATAGPCRARRNPPTSPATPERAPSGQPALGQLRARQEPAAPVGPPFLTGAGHVRHVLGQRHGQGQQPGQRGQPLDLGTGRGHGHRPTGEPEDPSAVDHVDGVVPAVRQRLDGGDAQDRERGPHQRLGLGDRHDALGGPLRSRRLHGSRR